MYKIYHLIGMVILTMAMPICILANNDKDTTVYLSDATGKATNTTVSEYAAKKWKEDNLWHLQIFFYPESRLKQNGLFSDVECTKKEGVFTSYYANGMMQDSGRFINNKREGTHANWFESGNPGGVEHYKNGYFVDTSVNFHENGSKSMIVIADEEGNGIQQEFGEDGKIRGSGRLALGKRQGGWIFKDGNNIVSQSVDYEMDSAMVITNYDEKGIKEMGINKVEKSAEFSGGLNGWRRFLERNLNYPEVSQRHGVQGVIRIQFIVGKDGTPSEIKILGNPDKDLAKEAKRIMTKSPNWIPAIQHNRKVTYRFVQTITFQLQ